MKKIPYKCPCGGTLRYGKCKVEFFGIDFGMKDCEICTSCGKEYIKGEIVDEILNETKRRGLFGLNTNIYAGKSGSVPVIRIPAKIRKFIGLKHKTPLHIYPVSNKRLVIDVLD